MIRFIHLSDVHLGAVPDRGCPWSHEREEEIWETFRRVIVGIRKNPVDLLFIAGDLFHRQPGCGKRGYAPCQRAPHSCYPGAWGKKPLHCR